MMEDELVAFAVYAGAAVIALTLYMRYTMRPLRWARRRSQSR
jgi:hypothetical protein